MRHFYFKVIDVVSACSEGQCFRESPESSDRYEGMDPVPFL